MSENESKVIMPGAAPVQASAVGLGMSASKFPGAINEIVKSLRSLFGSAAREESQPTTLLLSGVEGQRFEAYKKLSYNTVIVGENAVGNTVSQLHGKGPSLVIVDPATASTSHGNQFFGGGSWGNTIKLSGREEEYRFTFLRGIEEGGLRITHTPTGTDMGTFNGYQTVGFDNQKQVSVTRLCARTAPCRTSEELLKEYFAERQRSGQTPVSGGDGQDRGSGVEKRPEIPENEYTRTR